MEELRRHISECRKRINTINKFVSGNSDADKEKCEENIAVLAYVINALEEYQRYEALKEQGKLMKLPCAVGDTVYTNCSMQGWYFRQKNRPYVAKIVFIGLNGIDNYINIDFGDGHMLQFKFRDIGRTVFLSRKEAEAALKEL